MSENIFQKSSNKRILSVRNMTVTAMFIALACIAKFFQITVPIGGVAAMHISFAGVFSTVPAILLGPIIGAITGGITDIIGYLVSGYKEGAWVPILTLTAVASGLIKGLVWKFFSFKNKNTRIWLVCIFASIAFIGIFSTVSYYFLSDFIYTEFLKGMNNMKAVYFITYGLSLTGIVGTVLVCISKFTGEVFIKLIFTLLVPGIIVTTLNTFIIMDLYEVKSAFMIFYTPRLIEEVFICIIQAYIISLIFPLVEKGIKKL